MGGYATPWVEMGGAQKDIWLPAVSSLEPLTKDKARFKFADTEYPLALKAALDGRLGTRDVKFGLDPNGAESEWWVYDEDEPVPMGYIHWDQGNYYVSSRLALNNKEGNNTFKSYRLDIIIRKALKVLHPFTMGELALARVGALRQHLSNASRKRREEVSEAVNEIMPNSSVRGPSFFETPMMVALKEFMDSGGPTDEVLRGQIARVFALADHNYAEERRPISSTPEGIASFVHVKKDHLRTISVNIDDHKTLRAQPNLLYQDLGTVPQSLIDKITSLSILNNDQYVQQLGYKFRDDMYYVHE